MKNDTKIPCTRYLFSFQKYVRNPLYSLIRSKISFKSAINRKWNCYSLISNIIQKIFVIFVSSGSAATDASSVFDEMLPNDILLR